MLFLYVFVLFTTYSNIAIKMHLNKQHMHFFVNAIENDIGDVTDKKLKQNIIINDFFQHSLKHHQWL